MSEGAIVNGELRAAAGNNIRLFSSCSALLYCAVLDFRRVTIVYSVVHSTCRRIIVHVIAFALTLTLIRLTPYAYSKQGLA